MSPALARKAEFKNISPLLRLGTRSSLKSGIITPSNCSPRLSKSPITVTFPPRTSSSLMREISNKKRSIRLPKLRFSSLNFRSKILIRYSGSFSFSCSSASLILGKQASLAISASKCSKLTCFAKSRTNSPKSASSTPTLAKNRSSSCGFGRCGYSSAPSCILEHLKRSRCSGLFEYPSSSSSSICSRCIESRRLPCCFLEGSCRFALTE